MIALISDIHSNTEALQAVFDDMAAFDIEGVFCLGDVIGYGPEPRETLELVRERSRFVLLGNHEEGLLDAPDDFNIRARRALEWTRDQLNSPDHPKEANHGLWDFIDTFAREHFEDDLMFVHASPRNPIREYVLPEDALDRRKMAALYGAVRGRACFGGHTHVPGVFAEGSLFQHQSEFDGPTPLPGGKTIVNIGSVGQPRDGDNRASYVILDGDALIFRRVPYDIESTMRKIRSHPELDDFLAARLKAGK